MKLATLLLAMPLLAAPITFTSEGYINPIDGGFFFNLVNSQFYGNRMALLTPSTPVGMMALDIDNTPYMPGTGLCIATAQQDFGCYGSGQAFVGQVTVAHSDGSLIDRLILYTLAPFRGFIRERGTLSVRADTSAVRVPEPGAWVHLGLYAVVVVLAWWWVKGAAKRKEPERSEQTIQVANGRMFADGDIFVIQRSDNSTTTLEVLSVTADNLTVAPKEIERDKED